MMRGRRGATQPLRIAMVAACPFPSPRGSQVLVRELAEALACRGHAVHLVTYPRGENLVPIRGIFLHRLRLPRCLGGSRGLGWRKVALDICLGIGLFRVVRRHGIDVIHAHNYEAPLISYVVRWLTGVPVVYHSHNALSDELEYYVRPGWRRAVARRVGRLLDRHVPRRADFSIALTTELAVFLRRHGVADTRLAVIPPGGVHAVASELPTGEADAFGDAFVVMYTGNLDPYQDLDVLCDAFAKVHRAGGNAILVLVTHEPGWRVRADDRLTALVDAGVARVIVAPAFAVVRRLMTRADVLVCPRSSWSGFPIKLMNYLAAGRSIVVAEGSAKGIVDQQTGLVFRNRDADGLAQILTALRADPALRERLGTNARAAASAVPGWERVAAQVEGIYARVCYRREQPVSLVGRVRNARGLIAFSRDRISATSGKQTS